jgi:Mg2+-importing ATPase
LKPAFWTFSIPQAFAETNSAATGLASEEAAHRLQALPGRKETPPWLSGIFIFLRQFKSPLVLLLLAAVILSAVLGERSDAIIILFILLATGLLSFFQERNAGRTVQKLQALIAVKSNVIRDGEPVEIPAQEVVPGDIILLKAGDMVPADCYIIESNELHANEASLTGESFPVRKEPGSLTENTVLAKRTNCLWEGSSITSGTGKALVVFTGYRTLFGGLTKSLSAVPETTFEKGIRRFGFFLMQVTLVLAIIILVVNLLFQRPVIDSLLFALALAVGMAPELLPAVNTIAMSAGARRMLQKKVIVKKLSAIQNLGEVNLLCTDKTGTITEGEIKIAEVLNAEGEKSLQVQELAFMNASLQSGYSNPIDDALKKLPVTLPEGTVKVAEIPYDFIRKRLTVAVSFEQGLLAVTKGAVKNILEICSYVQTSIGLTEPIKQHREKIEQIYSQYGQQGFRVLGVCYKNIAEKDFNREDECDMIFSGFVLLQDPVKEGLQEALDALKALQLSVKIITGDNKIVAASTGKKIGLQQPVVLSGEEIQLLSTEALIQQAARTDIFAEVEPYQKERIIHALKKNYAVAYLGDGINDVAALNAADVGISIDNAVDVARSAADFVLLEKNLLVLADGIREGRKTFANTLKYIFINTGATFGNMFSVACASLILPFLPMLPVQILLTNFLSDIPFLAVAMDKVDESELKQSNKWNIGLIRKYMITFGLHSSIFDITTFIALYFVLNASEGIFQTGWFIESVLTEIFILYIMRTKKPFLKSRSSRLLLWLGIMMLTITLILPWWPQAYVFGLHPLSATVISTILVIVLLYVITADMLKIWFFRRMAAKETPVQNP